MTQKTRTIVRAPADEMTEPSVADTGVRTPAPNPLPGVHTGSDSISAAKPTTAAPKLPTKRALVLALLARDDGATLSELMTATGWQAHSVRAVLTGLRKSRIMLEKSIRDGATCYQMLEAGNA